MKKKFSIIALLLVLVVTFVTFGCTNAEDLNLEDVDKWNDLQILGSKDLDHCIKLNADNETIDWWIITDENGIVLEPGTDYEFVDENGNKKSGTESSAIAKDGSIYLKFKTDKAIVVWIHQSNVAPKKYTGDEDAAKGTKDFRGRIDIRWADQGYEVKASKYREEVSQVGVVEITCNETAKGKSVSGCKNGKWTGDYSITEVWPLTNKNGPQWEAAEGLKFIFTDNPINEGESRRVIYPAGNSVFAIKQPNRFAENPAKGSEEAEAKEKQVDWYWCAAFYPDNGTSSLISDTDASDLTFKELGPVKAHDENPLTSYECGAYFKLGDQTLYKSALGTTYIVDEFFEGSSEK